MIRPLFISLLYWSGSHSYETFNRKPFIQIISALQGIGRVIIRFPYRLPSPDLVKCAFKKAFANHGQLLQSRLA